MSERRKRKKRGEGAHEGGVNVRHKQFYQLLLDVERFDETGEAGCEDVTELVLVEETAETGVGSLFQMKSQLEEKAERSEEKRTSGSK
jgi:hypothetical protein